MKNTVNMYLLLLPSFKAIRLYELIIITAYYFVGTYIGVLCIKIIETKGEIRDRALEE